MNKTGDDKTRLRLKPISPISFFGFGWKNQEHNLKKSLEQRARASE